MQSMPCVGTVVMVTKMRDRCYSELIRLPTFEERFDYVKLSGRVGAETFGSRRYLNQAFYRSNEWRQVRTPILVRDNACDLAHPDHLLQDGMIAIIHHLNPILIDDLYEYEQPDFILDPENLITVWDLTHKAVHYGDKSLLPSPFVERRKNDTCPWKQ